MTVQVANNLSNARKEQPAGHTHTHPFAPRVPFAKSLILFRSGRYAMDGVYGKSAGVLSSESWVQYPIPSHVVVILSSVNTCDYVLVCVLVVVASFRIFLRQAAAMIKCHFEKY